MKKFITLVLIAAMSLSSVFSSSAAVIPAADGVIFVEGENYSDLNVGSDTGNNKDNNFSDNTALILKMPYGENPPPAGFFVEYTFTLPEEGAYEMNLVSTPLNADLGSAIAMQANGGEIVKITSSNSSQLSKVDVPTYKDVFSLSRVAALPFKAGVNKLKIYLDEPRKLDGRYFFFIDYITFKMVPWGIKNIDILDYDCLGIYEEGAEPKFRMNFYSADKKENTAVYKIYDFWGEEVFSESITIPIGNPYFDIELPAMEKGHYTIIVTVLGSDSAAENYFSVLTPLEKRPKVESSPFSMDTALSWLTPLEKIDEYSKALALSGIQYVRERFRWSTSNPQSGVYSYNNGSYDDYYDAIAKNGTKILNMFSSAPAWTKTTTDRKSTRLNSSH